MNLCALKNVVDTLYNSSENPNKVDVKLFASGEYLDVQGVGYELEKPDMVSIYPDVEVIKSPNVLCNELGIIKENSITYTHICANIMYILGKTYVGEYKAIDFMNWLEKHHSEIYEKYDFKVSRVERTRRLEILDKEPSFVYDFDWCAVFSRLEMVDLYNNYKLPDEVFGLLECWVDENKANINHF